MIAAQLNVMAGGVLAAESVPNDGVGSTSLHPIWAPIEEVIIGGLATLIVFAMLYKLAWPAISKGMKDRTARIQGELDTSAASRTQAEADAAGIRTSLGDVDGERSRLFAEADAQAATLLEDGRLRLTRKSKSSKRKRLPTSPPLRVEAPMTSASTSLVSPARRSSPA